MTHFSKKLGLLTLSLTILFTNPLISMDAKDADPKANSMTISAITPIEPGMNKEEARQAIIGFFHKDVSLQRDFILGSQISKQEYVQVNPEGGFYILKTIYPRQEDDGAGRVIEGKDNGGRMFILTTLKDGTLWIQGNKGLERFLGARYLNKSLVHHNLQDQWRAVPTKAFLTLNQDDTITINIKSARAQPLINVFTINSDNFTSFSQYVGNSKLSIFDTSLPKEALQKLTGFADFPGNVNLIPHEGTKQVTIIDTEYASFDNAGTTPPSDPSEKELGGQTFTFTLDELFI